jgi:beta-lactamase class A
MEKRKHIMTLVLVGCTLFIAGFLLSTVYFHISHTHQIVGRQARENNSEYKYINPILFAEIGTKDQFTQFSSLIKKADSYINQQVASKNANSISLYVRELNTGYWTGINENEKYAPASMLKVALMLAYLKQAEKDPFLLEKKIKYEGIENDIQNYKPKAPLIIGKYYTVRELIQDMIIHSSNISNQLLLNNIDHSFLTEVYTTLELPLPKADAIDFLSAKSYSTLFRTLYSSTFLPRASSDTALELLTRSDFTNGIVAGVPEGTIVAHKFGERVKEVAGQSAEQELHDCGIVYYPGNSYFICVMTRGSSFQPLETIIKDLSKITYNEMIVINQAQQY